MLRLKQKRSTNRLLSHDGNAMLEIMALGTYSKIIEQKVDRKWQNAVLPTLGKFK